MAERPDGFVETVKEWAEQPLFRQVATGGAVLLATVLVGAVIGTVIGGSVGHAGPAISGLQPAAIGELIDAPKAKPTVLKTPLAMGTQKAGIAVIALSAVDQVQTKTGTRKAPPGSRMLAFRVGNGPCEQTPCKSWNTLNAEISIDAIDKPLNPHQDTYVAVVPPGTSDVNLLIDVEGVQQAVSLLGDDSVAAGNITLLAKPGLTKPTTINQSFRLAEQTSVALTGPNGLPTNTFYRNVKVGIAQRHYFLNGSTPTRASNCFLVVTTAYSYDGQTTLSAFDPSEITFVIKQKTYHARDLDPDPNVSLLGFEIPAAAKSGTLMIGGTMAKVSTTGVAYQSTLQTRAIKIALH